jgi:hypothetical protein
LHHRLSEGRLWAAFLLLEPVSASSIPLDRPDTMPKAAKRFSDNILL